MKYTLTLPLVIAALCFSAFSSASAQTTVKIGTVDMKKVFENYYKTKDAEARINEARNAAKKELEDRMDTYKKGTEEVQKLNEEIGRKELSDSAKAEKSKTRDEKIAELKTMEREIREFQTTREKQLQEQSVRMRGGIVEGQELAHQREGDARPRRLVQPFQLQAHVPGCIAAFEDAVLLLEIEQGARGDRHHQLVVEGQGCHGLIVPTGSAG